MSEIKNGRLGLYGTEHSKCDRAMTLTMGFKGLELSLHKKTVAIKTSRRKTTVTKPKRLISLDYMQHLYNLVILEV